MQTSLAKIFQEIYKYNRWSDNETVSGGGSRLDRTVEVRETLPALLAGLGVRTLLDAGCGDMNWLSTLDLGNIEVQACDIVPELIAINSAGFSTKKRKFLLADITVSPLPQVDLILCRTVLFHLSFANVQKALTNFTVSGSTWLLTTTHPHHMQNIDIQDGQWRRLNLRAEPFNLPEPLQSFRDGPGDDGYLGLWKLGTRN